MVALDGPAAHYLLNVMRAKPGDPLLLFDNRSGEWLGAVAEASKRALSIRIEHQMRPIERVPDLWLCFAPVKKARLKPMPAQAKATMMWWMPNSKK